MAVLRTAEVLRGHSRLCELNVRTDYPPHMALTVILIVHPETPMGCLLSSTWIIGFGIADQTPNVLQNHHALLINVVPMSYRPL